MNLRYLVRSIIRESSLLDGPYPSGAMTKDADIMIDAAQDHGQAVAHGWLHPEDKMGVYNIMRPYSERYLNADQDKETVMYDFLAHYQPPDHFDEVRKALDHVRSDVDIIGHGKNGEVIVKVNKSVARDAVQPLGFRVIGYDSNGTADHAFMTLIPNYVHIWQEKLYPRASWRAIVTTPERTRKVYFTSLLHAMDETKKYINRYGQENVAGPDSEIDKNDQLVDPRMPSVSELRAKGELKP